jgi:hypothetical protein
VLFETLGVHRIAGSVVLAQLMELPDGCGTNGAASAMIGLRAPGELSRPLRPFGIKPQTIWPLRRGPDDRSSRGNLRSQFEASWMRLSRTNDTTSQGHEVNPIVSHHSVPQKHLNGAPPRQALRAGRSFPIRPRVSPRQRRASFARRTLGSRAPASRKLFLILERERELLSVGHHFSIVDLQVHLDDFGDP